MPRRPRRIPVSGWLVVSAIVLVAMLSFHGSAGPWERPSLRHPLGTDEFGRDTLSIAGWSILNSLLAGGVLAGLALAVGIAAASIAVFGRNRLVASIVVTAGHVVESVPLLLWLLVVVAVIPEPIWLAEGLAFTLATLPVTSRVVIGEFERLLGQPFVGAARLLGMRPVRLMFRHLIPNAGSVLFPLAVQLCGFAIAINGAIGVVGFGNRSRLDLGTWLLRGKEHAFTEPHLLATGLVALVAVYVFLWGAFVSTADPTSREPDWV